MQETLTKPVKVYTAGSHYHAFLIRLHDWDGRVYGLDMVQNMPKISTWQKQVVTCCPCSTLCTCNPNVCKFIYRSMSCKSPFFAAN